MSYAIYKTDAIIARVIPNGESSLDVVFLTKDLGKITARAQGTRKIESKMRMHIKRYSHVTIDAVRGKSVWRLTGISQVAPHKIFANDLFLKSIHRVLRLAEFLIQGEEPHQELFEFFLKLFSYVDARLSVAAPGEELFQPIDKIEAEGLEIFGVVQVLEKLGYWEGEKLAETPTIEILKKCSECKKELVAMINESIGATQIV